MKFSKVKRYSKKLSKLARLVKIERWCIRSTKVALYPKTGPTSIPSLLQVLLHFCFFSRKFICEMFNFFDVLMKLLRTFIKMASIFLKKFSRVLQNRMVRDSMGRVVCDYGGVSSLACQQDSGAHESSTRFIFFHCSSNLVSVIFAK